MSGNPITPSPCPLQNRPAPLVDTPSNKPKKRVHRTEYVRHPLSNKRLAVMDSFCPDKIATPPRSRETEYQRDVVCKQCGGKIEKVMTVEPDSDHIDCYCILVCAGCRTQSWFIILP